MFGLSGELSAQSSPRNRRTALSTFELPIKSFTYEDPKRKHQKSLPKQAFLDLRSDATNELTKAIGELTTIALFFGMRSCEFVTVPKPGKTKLLQLKDIRFFQNNKNVQFNQLRQSRPDTLTVTLRSRNINA